ncbi:natural resistance-associated macrophage protein [Halopolyspora algeriensis]|uniref:Natural resistance-associated macrophage protein n=1 Tax=Halopolyspora algeriensis TaxID=1500506 RepID=A0A368VZP5_9ACTN|nr:Nramp family divalent metal transporter [Halopolyspora algeriensis]RCW45811.1 natural resistance-associated macrophage protein [Halopolyspora algeriensis]TQM54195.1 natural resistance-associated macrophage protein [Halopolyspora algeriensis]
MTTQDTDTAAEPVLRLPTPPAALQTKRISVITALKFFGPGAVIASLTIGSGESILASREGAVFGYTVLWAIMIGVIAKGALVYASNRHITLTGEHPITRFAQVFPGPRGWFPLLLAAICLVSFPGWASGVAVALGDYLQSLGAGNATFYALAVVAAAGILSFLGGYGLLEKAQVAIAGFMVVLVLAAVFVARPDWLGVLSGLVPGHFDYAPFVLSDYPEIAATPAWVELAVFMGGLGGGMYDYIGYSGMLREKRWGMLGHPEIAAIRQRLSSMDQHAPIPLSSEPAEVAKAKAWSRAPKLDTLAAFVAMGIIAAAFMINGATILGTQHQVPTDNEVLNLQSQFLATVAPLFEYFYIVAIVMVLFGTVYALWEVYTWTTYESLAAVSTSIRRRGQRGIRPYVYGWIALGSAMMILSGASFVALITPAALLGGVFACGLYGAGLLYVDHVNMPLAYRMGPALRLFVALGSAFLAIAGILALLSYTGVIA